MVALLMSFLITGSLWGLAMTYFLYLPGFSAVSVQKEDRSIVRQLYAIATNAFLIALLSGLVLGICLPVAYRWGRTRRNELTGVSNANPALQRSGDSGVAEGPPSGS